MSSPRLSLSACCRRLRAAAQRTQFRIEEATIADIHRAILARQLTATQLVNAYLKRIAAYNGTCVKGAVDPATGFQLGDIEPVEHAGQINALITINLRGKRSKTDTVDNDPNMPDALEVCAARLTRNSRGPASSKDRCTGSRSPSRTSSIPSICERPAGRQRTMPMTVLRAMRRWSRGYAARARSFSPRPIWANTPPATAAPSGVRPAIPTTPAAAPAARAAAQAPRSRPIWRRALSARKPARRRAIRRPTTAWSASSRPTAWSAAPVWYRPRLPATGAGVLCRTVRDAATVLSALAGYDAKDAATAESVGRMPGRPYQAFAEQYQSPRRSHRRGARVHATVHQGG